MSSVPVVMSDTNRLKLEQFQLNAMEIARLEEENKRLQQDFIPNISDTYETSWRFLQLELNRFLRGCPYARASKPVTIDDCQLELRRRYIKSQEFAEWFLILPQEDHTYKYWPELDITNMNYLLHKNYDLGFVRYLANNGKLNVKLGLN